METQRALELDCRNRQSERTPSDPRESTHLLRLARALPSYLHTKRSLNQHCLLHLDDADEAQIYIRRAE
jgi:hypothetical protein